MSQDASGVHPLKRVQRIGDAGAAADVVHLLGDVIERRVDVSVAKQVG